MIRIDNVMIEDYDLRLMTGSHIKLSANLCKTIGLKTGDQVVITADEGDKFYIAKSDDGRTLGANRTISSKSAYSFLNKIGKDFNLTGEVVDFEGSTYYAISVIEEEHDGPTEQSAKAEFVESENMYQ